MTAPVLIHVATIEHVAMIDHVVSIDHVMTIATNEIYRNFQTIRDYNQRAFLFAYKRVFSCCSEFLHRDSCNKDSSHSCRIHFTRNRIAYRRIASVHECASGRVTLCK